MTENPDGTPEAPAAPSEPDLGPPAQAFVTAITTLAIALALLAAVVLYYSWPAIERALNCH